MFALRTRTDASASTRRLRAIAGIGLATAAALGLTATVVLASVRPPAGIESAPHHDDVQVTGTVLGRFDAIAFDRGAEPVTTVYYVRFGFETPDGQSRINVCTVSGDVYERVGHGQPVTVTLTEGRVEQSCIAA